MKKLPYNKSVEVKEKTRIIMAKVFPGIIAHRHKNGKYFIKRSWPAYRKETEKLLNQLENKSQTE